MKTSQGKTRDGLWRIAAGVPFCIYLCIAVAYPAGVVQGQDAAPTPEATTMAATAAPEAAAVATTEPAPAVAVTVAPAAASAPAAEGEIDKKLATLWDDFLHGIKVAREDLAESAGRAILESGASPRQVYLLSVQEGDVQWLLTRGEGLKNLPPIIAAIRKMIEDGYQAERSDPNQIARSIDLLGQNLRAYEIGASRLSRSGEYAVPQLIQKLMDRSTSAMLTERVVTVLPRLGKDAVRPLSEALKSKDPALVQIVAETLGKIRYPDAAAALKELLERKDLLDRTRQIATAALIACGGEAAAKAPVSSVLYDLAEKYYYDRQSVPVDANVPMANVWYWREGLGLEGIAVPRAIFGDVYAMRLAQAALKYDPSFQPAVSLWLAAKMRQEIQLPLGAKNPTEQAGEPAAKFYALAGSAKYLQDVLARAIRDDDAALALKAIEALAETAGAQSLVEPAPGGVQPLVAALTNRNGQVRLMAAMTLADALPQKHFQGDERVVAVLNEALRQCGRRKALLVDADPAQQNLLKDALRTAGYEVIDEPDPDKALVAAREASGVDLAILGAKPDPVEFVGRLRNDQALAALPVLVAASDEKLQRLARDDSAVVLLEAATDSDKMAAAISQAAKKAPGSPQTPEQAATWAIRAAEAIALLGQTGNPVYDISKTAGVLAQVAADQRADVAMAAAKALAVISTDPAQQALADRAETATLDEKMRVDLLKLLAASLRRYGNLLGESQTNAILGTVIDKKQSQAVREAAAEALGAMNLPSEKIKGLIVEEGGTTTP
jgi:HEAT repeat protein